MAGTTKGSFHKPSNVKNININISILNLNLSFNSKFKTKIFFQTHLAKWMRLFTEIFSFLIALILITASNCY